MYYLIDLIEIKIDEIEVVFFFSNAIIAYKIIPVLTMWKGEGRYVANVITNTVCY